MPAAAALPYITAAVSVIQAVDAMSKDAPSVQAAAPAEKQPIMADAKKAVSTGFKRTEGATKAGSGVGGIDSFFGKTDETTNTLLGG